MEYENDSQTISPRNTPFHHCNSNESVHFAIPLPTVNCQLSTVNWIHTFSAKEKDAETGYSYFGSRYYSSDLSIWLSVDPLADNFSSVSPYNYCSDNPLKLKDPNGEGPVLVRCAIGAFVGAAINATCAIVEGKSPSEVVAAAAGGAVSGAVQAIAPGNKALATIAAAGDFVEQEFNVMAGNKDNIDYGEVAVAGLTGAVCNKGANVANKQVEAKAMQQTANAKNAINKEVKKEMKNQGYTNGQAAKKKINLETKKRVENYQNQKIEEGTLRVNIVTTVVQRESTNAVSPVLTP